MVLPKAGIIIRNDNRMMEKRERDEILPQAGAGANDQPKPKKLKSGKKKKKKGGIAEPGVNDVISGRGDTINRHPG